MHSILILFYTLFLTKIIYAITYSNRHDYDAYGTSVASTNHFVVLAQNDGYRYVVSMAPYGPGYTCGYDYITTNNFVINIAVSRRQSSSQLSFVYLQTNSTDGYYQKLGLFTFSREINMGLNRSTCSRILDMNKGENEVKVWYREPSELSTLQVDLDGKYAYGFLSKAIFIYDIENNSVQDLLWNDTFPSIYLEPHALDIGKTNDNISMAIVAGYYQFDIEKTLPAVYLVRLNPPYDMTLVDNYTIMSDDQKFVRGRDSSSYRFNYVMSVSIHDSTQQVMVAIPQLSQIYLFSFTSTHLTFINSSNRPARSTAWLNKNGTQVGLLLSGVTTLPWAESRIEIINMPTTSIFYVYPNNQQILLQWSNIPPTFIRLTVTYDYQLVILTTDGIVVLVPAADAGYYMITDDINSNRNPQIPCPYGTYKSIRGTTPCTVCPPGTKSSSTSNKIYPTINCTACLTSSFCPLASITDINQSSIQSISQAYAYPSSPSTTSFDDILMQNTFNLETKSFRCLYISPFFWALITLIIAFIILIVMGVLYYSSTGMKHFHRLECFFRHSDLIGNGELWFGGLMSFAIITLIIYCFWFSIIFTAKYPIETSTDADFACDTSLRNTQFSSLLQLLTILKSDQEKPIFTMLDEQNFTLTLNFIQTGYTCDSIAAQENVGTYSVSFPPGNCTKQADNATLTVAYQIPYHQINLQINLTGLYYIGGLFICLTGPRSTSNDSMYVVQEMDYCDFFYTSDQTLGQTTEFYFALTKIINATDALDYSGSINYSGIWIPTSTHGSLNDHLAYDQRGVHIRYLSTQHTIIISFSETQFYVINQQQPIARMGEVIFHSIIFTTTIIGIFAFGFLIFKLIFMPIVLWIIKRRIFLLKFCNFKKHEKLKNDNSF